MSKDKSNPQREKPQTAEQTALEIVQTLVDAGHTALFAGGCVRDMLMGSLPKDYDVATSALPDQVVKLFRRTQSVGAKFGVVLVRKGEHAIEVATFRTDLSYSDGRRPVEVVFTTPEQDAQRRDFTVNGMFYNPLTRQVVDYVGGQADLEAKLLRAIGDPEHRFEEDHLRMLRAIRFSARLQFEIEAKTWEAIHHHAEQIRRISPERILMELTAILGHASRGKAIDQLHRSGLLYQLWHGADMLRAKIDDAICLLAALPPAASFELGLTALLHTLSAHEVERICKALRASNYTLDRVEWLVKNQAAMDDPSALSLADLKLLMAHPAFCELMMLTEARVRATKKDLIFYNEIQRRVKAIAPEDVAPPPLLTGHDLAELGIAQGPAYKRILDRVYYAQLNGDITDRENALQLAKELAPHKELL